MFISGCTGSPGGAPTASHSQGLSVAISTRSRSQRVAHSLLLAVSCRQRGSAWGEFATRKAGMASPSGAVERISSLLFSVDERDQPSRDDRTLPGKDCGWCWCCSAVAVACIRDARLRPHAVGLHPSSIQLLAVEDGVNAATFSLCLCGFVFAPSDLVDFAETYITEGSAA